MISLVKQLRSRGSLVHGVGVLQKLNGQQYLLFSSQIASNESEVEQKLRQNLDVVDIKATDISGGCGTMFSIAVEAHDFKGKSTVQQHAMVYKLFQKELKEQWHGVELNTKTPQQQ